MFSFSGCIWKKILPSLSLGHAIHVSHSCQYEFSDAGREAALPAGDQPPFPGLTGHAWGEARPPASARVCRGGRLPLPLQQSLSIIVADTGRWRWCAPRVGTRGAGRGNHNCPAEPKLATMSLFPCHSVYLEFALHMLWVYALFICSLKSHAWKRKRRNPVT